MEIKDGYLYYNKGRWLDRQLIKFDQFTSVVLFFVMDFILWLIWGIIVVLLIYILLLSLYLTMPLWLVVVSR